MVGKVRCFENLGTVGLKHKERRKLKEEAGQKALKTRNALQRRYSKGRVASERQKIPLQNE